MITFFSFLSKLQLFVQERLDSQVESVGDEDIARALLAACKGAAEPVLNTYDQLLSSGAILPSPNLRLRVLRSVLVVLREWAMSVFAKRMGTSATGASLILGGTFSADQTTVINQGIRDKITSAANRSCSEVKILLVTSSLIWDGRYSSFKVKNNFLKLGLAKTFVRAKHVYGRIGLGFFGSGLNI
ncbi:hypothetical protein CUMW_172570 [Citrus unshiu]|uniref:Uncharacterized protein n=1 Tax=Citrus unshiu TaxID=55188 RepID=A0A2H5PVX6_CITUN|nr:hypothetical protein CUMW_172570 [Citrus unshiu]